VYLLFLASGSRACESSGKASQTSSIRALVLRRSGWALGHWARRAHRLIQPRRARRGWSALVGDALCRPLV